MRNRLTHSLVRRAMELITVESFFFYSEERFIRSKLQARARVVNGIVDRLDPCSSLVHRALEMSFQILQLNFYLLKKTSRFYVCICVVNSQRKGEILK
jgi:hypothetical protein